MRIQRESYQRARNAEKIADLCWQLADLIRDNYVGYEEFCSKLYSVVIEFEKEFDSLVDNYYA